MEESRSLSALLSDVLAGDRTLLGRRTELLAALDARAGDVDFLAYSAFQQAIQDSTVGERLLTADGGTAEAQAAAIDQALADLLAVGMQEDAATRTLEILVRALGWDAGDADDAPNAQDAPTQPEDEPRIDFRALNDYLAEREEQFQAMQKHVQNAMEWVRWLQSELEAVKNENAALQEQCNTICQQAQQSIAYVQADAAQNLATARAAAKEQITALRDEIQQLREELAARDKNTQDEFQRLREEQHATAQRLRDEWQTEIRKLRDEEQAELRKLRDERQETQPQKHAAPQTTATDSADLALTHSQMNAWKRCLTVYHEQFEQLQDTKTTFLTQQKLFKTWKVIGLGCANKFDRMSDPTLPAIFQKSALADYWAFPFGKSLYAVVPKLPARCHKTLQTAGALGELFDSNYEDGEYTVDHVDAPAVFRKDQEAWTFLKKGKLRLKRK